MHRLPLVSKSALRLNTDGVTSERKDPIAKNCRFGARDYLRYSAKLAGAMVSSRVFGRHRPLMVNIEPTHRCNLDCVYCDKGNSQSLQMQTDSGLRIIDEFAAMGTLTVCFDGGEPLVHPGIEQFVRRAKLHGMRVSMSTNGHLIRRKPEVMTCVDMFKISIDGPRHIHDAGRGDGSFDKALQGAQLAVESGAKVAIRMTLAEHNLQHYREVLQFAKAMRIAALFQPAVGSVLNGSSAPDAHCANAEVYRNVIDELKLLKSRGEPVANEIVCLDHQRSWPDPKPVPFCSGGRILVVIGPDGGMFPCGRTGRHLPAPNVFSLGVAKAFKQVMRPTECANCWSTLTLAACYLYRGDLGLLTGR